MSAPAGVRGGLGLVGAVARRLNGAQRPAEALGAVVELLRAGLGARRVTCWLRAPQTGRFEPIAAPRPAGPLAPESLATLDALPPAGPELVRVPVERSAERLGVLEAELAPAAGAEAAEVLAVVADVLGPFLASLEVSEGLAYEAALHAREIDAHRRFTSHVIDCLPVGLYVVDRQYRIQVWNRKRETGTQGLRRDEVVGRRVFDVLTRQPADQLRAELDRVFREGRTLRSEVEVDAGGERRHYRITKLPMRLEGDAVTHVITIGEDVTEWRHIQARILQSEKLAAVGQLAAGIMHEINNPLATIGACAAALEGRAGDPSPGAAAAILEYVAIIDKEVQRCTRIIDGLLDFSRPKGKQKAPVSLSALAEDALFLLRHHKRYRQVEVAAELEPGLPPVLGNAEQLVQALLALMLNALDALEPGGRLTVRTRGGRGAREAVLEVEDTGAGIPREEQPKIFEPFFTTKAPGRGTGLGLSICYGIVQEHRGRIEVDSQPGQGSTFRVILPTADTSDPAEAARFSTLDSRSSTP